MAASLGDVVLLARSTGSAERALERTGVLAGKMGADDADFRVTTDVDELHGSTFVIEAIVEDSDPKRELLQRLGAALGPDTILATTTSSLNVSELAEASGRPDRFAALHVFNPVTKMELVELAFPEAASARTRERAHALCRALGKTAVEVPDIPGFVVNRLLFPYLFDAVRLMEQTGLAAEDIDRCMNLGAGHPMGPLALLDFVGLDVAAAIGESIGVEVPERVRALIEDGALGRKSGRGLLSY